MSSSSIPAPHVPPRPLRDPDLIEQKMTKDEVTVTATSVEQHEVEIRCLRLLQRFHDRNPSAAGGLVGPHLRLNRKITLDFLQQGLKDLSESYSCLDASRPWLIYWITHALELLGTKPAPAKRKAIIGFLSRCRNPDGGFGGGPGQMSHLAPTYATVNALAILGDEKGYGIVDRQRLAEWLDGLRMEDGSFRMHEDGEVDIRGVYCALSVAKMTNTFSPELFRNTEQWLLRCQTYEGGFGAAPGMEAHGGYTFCGLASLIFLGHERLCNLDRLLSWVTRKQMSVEGGFQGRTNKLVDGCYSFWQGGVFPLLHSVLAEDGHLPALSRERWLFDQEALQEYLLICCQDPRGGLVDKPGKTRDFYHTSYALSGLSVAQNFNWAEGGDDDCRNRRLVGDEEENSLLETHSLFNVGREAAYNSTLFFSKLPSVSVKKQNSN